MGASGWSYFVAYEPDIQHALDKLRAEVFQGGEYYVRPNSQEHKDEASFAQSIAKIPEEDRNALLEMFRAEQRRVKPEVFTSIEQLREWNREEGTHSILDITTAVSEPLDPAYTQSWLDMQTAPTLASFRHTFGKTFPLTNAQLQALFETTMPTHAQIEQVAEDLDDLRERWVGLHIIVYQGDQPHEIFFTGFSGD